MIDLDSAKMHLKDTLDSAFSKKAGTKKQRADLVKVCCSKIPTNRTDSVALLIYGMEYIK